MFTTGQTSYMVQKNYTSAIFHITISMQVLTHALQNYQGDTEILGPPYMYVAGSLMSSVSSID